MNKGCRRKRNGPLYTHFTFSVGLTVFEVNRGDPTHGTFEAVLAFYSSFRLSVLPVRGVQFGKVSGAHRSSASAESDGAVWQCAILNIECALCTGGRLP